MLSWSIHAEPVLPIGGVEDDRVLGILHSMPSHNHLAEKTSGCFALACLIFQPLNLLAELGQLRERSCRFLLFSKSLFLVFFNLLLSAASLRASLH